jgi:uncharacterized membrane protein YkoI
MIKARRRGSAFLLAGVIFAGVFSRGAFADDYERAYRLRESGEILPLEQILEIALKSHPGRVLEVDLDREEGRRVYEIEIVDQQGVVWELEFDAGDGRLLEKKRER